MKPRWIPGELMQLPYIAFAIYQLRLVLSMRLDTSSWNIGQALGGLVLVLLLFVIVSDYANYTISWFVAICGIAGVLVLTAPNLDVLILLGFLLCAHRMQLKYTAAISLTVMLIGVGWTAFSAVMGVIPNSVLVRADTGETRHSLGFVHPNSLGLAAVCIGVAWFTIHGGQLRRFLMIPLVVAIIIAAVVADSRSSVATLVVLVIGSIFFQWRDRVISANLLRFFCAGALIIAPLVSIVAVIMYNSYSSFWTFLNSALSWRILVPVSYYDVIGFPTFAVPLDMFDGRWASITAGGAGFLLDNAYLRLIYLIGALPAAAFFALLCALIIRADLPKSSAPSLFLLAVLLILGVFENPALYFFLNYQWITVASQLRRSPSLENSMG